MISPTILNKTHSSSSLMIKSIDDYVAYNYKKFLLYKTTALSTYVLQKLDSVIVGKTSQNIKILELLLFSVVISSKKGKEKELISYISQFNAIGMAETKIIIKYAFELVK